MTVGIYCFTNKVNGKRYVGQSWTCEARIKEHFRNSLSGSIIHDHFYKAIRKYGACNWNVEILATVHQSRYSDVQDILNKFEAAFINAYQTLAPKYGYNKMTGGNHGRLSDETKRKIGAANREAMRNGAAIRVGNSNRGKKSSAETIELMRASLRKHWSCPSVRERASKQKRGGLNPSARRTREKSTQLVFSSLKEASDHFQVSYADAYQSCRMNAGQSFLKSAISRLAKLSFQWDPQL